MKEEGERIRPIYVVYGKDRRRVWDKAEEVLEELLAGCERQVSLSSYDGEEAVLSEVLEGLRTLPFLSPRRVVMVKDAGDFIKKHRQDLEKYLEEPSATGVLMLVGESFAGNTRLAKRAAKIGKVYNCEPIKSEALGGFIREYARRRHQLVLEPAAAELLIELAGKDTGLLCGEVDKLAAYIAGPEERREKIRVSDVEALVGHNRLYDAFNVIDAMMEGDAGEALRQLDQMLRQDRKAEFKAIGAFAWHFRRLHEARRLSEQGVRDREIVRRLRVWPRPKEFMGQVKRLSLAEMGDIFSRLMEIDTAVKSSQGTVRAGLEKMIVQFCQGFEKRA